MRESAIYRWVGARIYLTGEVIPMEQQEEEWIRRLPRFLFAVTTDPGI